MKRKDKTRKERSIMDKNIQANQIDFVQNFKDNFDLKNYGLKQKK